MASSKKSRSLLVLLGFPLRQIIFEVTLTKKKIIQWPSTAEQHAIPPSMGFYTQLTAFLARGMQECPCPSQPRSTRISTGIAKNRDSKGAWLHWVHWWVGAQHVSCAVPSTCKAWRPTPSSGEQLGPKLPFHLPLATKSSRFQTRQAQFICLRSQSRGKRFPDSHTITAALRRNTRTSWN